MVFAIKKEAMNGPERVLNLLDSVLARVEGEVHEMEIADADFLESSAWYDSCRRDRRKMLEKVAEALLHRAPRSRGPHLRRIEVTDEGTAQYARSMANTPLTLLVENSESDGALVKAALKAFSSSATCELCLGFGALQAPKAFSIDSGGGYGELTKRFAQYLKEAGARGVDPRIIVMTESDGEWIGDVKNYVRACQKSPKQKTGQLFFKMLRKRNGES